MSISVKRVYEAPEPDDGLRVLVDRIWPRGVSKEEAKIDLWLKEIAPSTGLRKWFGHDPEKWDEFQARYRAELEGSEALAELRRLSRRRRVTLVYGARDEKHNNAQALRRLISRSRQ
jgi:uncharacterized protein YeaO (DUF488 family)